MLNRPLVPLVVPLVAFALVVALSGCEDVSVTQVTVATLEVDPPTATLLPNQTLQLSTTAYDASGEPLSGRSAAWTALDPEVATVSESGLVRGVSPGTARIRATLDGQSATAAIQVGSAPRIALSEPAVQFSATAGSGPTQPLSVGVTNGGGGSLTGLGTSISWVEGPGGWLEATLSGTSAPTTLSLRATPGSLAPGRYEALVTVTPAGSGANPGTLSVVFHVSEPHPTIGLSAGAVGFASSEGQPAPSSQTVRITNAGGGSVTGLNASISYASGGATGWLTATLERSSAPADLVLRVNPQGLTPGVHDAQVRITASGSGQAAVVQVRYRYGEAPPQFAVSPGSLSRTVQEGGAPTGPDTIRITNSGTGTLDGITLSVDYSGSARGWVNARLSSSRAPAQLIVTLDPEGLAPGIYEARARLVSSAAVNSPTTVLLRLTVEARTIRPSASRSTVGSSPTIVDRGEPSTILVQLRDADGNAMTTGGDEVFLRTTHGTLSRTSGTTDNSGRFTATLTSNSTGVAAVSAHLGSSASDPLIGTTTVTILLPGGSDPDPGQSTIVATPSQITAWETSTIVVQLRDAAGNVLRREGEDIVLRASAGRLSRTSGKTDSDGRFVAVLDVNPSNVGTLTITAWLGTNTSDDDKRIGSAQVRVTR